MSPRNLEEDEIKFIKEAAGFLENPSRSMKLMNLLGKPIDSAQKQLPPKVRAQLSRIVDKALHKALHLAMRTIQAEGPVRSWNEATRNSNVSRWTHTASAAATGAAGGFLGPLSILVELPLSTAIILRGISSVASEWGHDLSQPEIQLQCLYVFSLGSNESKADDELDSAYLTSRVAFTKIIQEAASFISLHGARAAATAIEKGHAPILVQFIARVAALFELSLSEKLLAKAIPVIGSVGGATINAIFCNYFVAAARYHFGLLHLEKKYGRDVIQSTFAGKVADLPDESPQVSGF